MIIAMTKKHKPKITIQKAKIKDINGMLEVEFERYAQLYKEQPEKKLIQRHTFERRLAIAKKWMWVARMDGRIVGFISGQPTDMKPKDFTSWEEVTDNGTLERTYKSGGKNVYVVNLDVSRSATKYDVQYMLMAALGGKLLKMGKDIAIFESRMPGFRTWIYEESNIGEKLWSKLTDKQKLDEAESYAAMKIDRKGKLVRKDRLLRFYEEAGMHFVKVLPNAFKDGESLDFGMLCTAKNPIPPKFRNSVTNNLIGTLLSRIGKNEKLLSRFVG